MVSSRVKSKSAACPSNKITIKVIAQNPDSLIGVKTSRVYSQIARMSRDPRKQTERAFLITVLEESSVTTIVNGKTVKKDPPFVREGLLKFKKLAGWCIQCLCNSK